MTSTTYDQGREQPLTVTDQNGEKTTETYDPLGRLTSVITPVDQASGDPTDKFSYSVTATAPPAVTTQTLREDGSYGTDVKIYDGMGQLRQEQATPANAGTGRVITDKFYDSDGWVVKVHNPYYDSTTSPDGTLFEPTGGDGSIPGWTSTTYDGMGRVLTSAFNSDDTQQWETTTAYPGLNETDVTPPSGGTATSAFTNILGQTTASWQYTTVAAPNGNSADADVTSYTYTPAGLTNTVSDNAGNTWTFGYDLLGEKTSESDPGTTQAATWTYDGAGNIASSTDSDGNEISYAYDILGRKVAEYKGSLSGAELDAWTYDQAPLNGGSADAVGELTSATSMDTYGGLSGGPYTEKVTGYNTAYQPTGTKTSIPAGDLVPGTSGSDSFTTTNIYTPLTGMLSSTAYSADEGLPAETVNYSYDLEGELIASGGVTAYLDQTIYDPFGQVQRTTYGLYGQQLVQTYTQDPGTHWLTASTTNLQTYSQAADSVSYAYSEAGDLSAASDAQNAGGTETQCYAYNDQQELTQAWTDKGGITTDAAPKVSGIGACANSTPSASSLGGPAQYWESFSYDLLGDRTSATFYNTSGNSSQNIVQTLTYPGNGTTPAAQPNAPASIVTQYGTAGSKDSTAVHYDAAGNTTSQAVTTTGSSPPPVPAPESGVIYNPQGQTAGVTTSAGTSGFTYDASGNLLFSADPASGSAPASTTLYLDGGAEQITYTAALGSSPADTVARRFYPGPDGTVITRSYDNGASSTSLTYQPGTPQGSATDSVTDNSSQAMTRRYFDPFGNAVGSSVSWPDNLGFVNKPADAVTSLDLLGARQYEPVTGRFLSLDPLFEAGDPQAMGGYSYADDNPSSNADPSGLECAAGASSNGSCNDQPVQSSGGGGGSGDYTDSGYGDYSTSSGDGYWDGGYGGTYSESAGNTVTAHLTDLTRTFQVPPPPATRTAVTTASSGPMCTGRFATLVGCDPTPATGASSAGSGPSSGTLLTLGAILLTVVNIAQLGADPATDALEVADVGALVTDEAGTVADDDALSDAAASCGGESFTAGTKVLLASGAAIPISSIRRGEKVLAVNVRTGRAGAEDVVAVLVHYDTGRYHLRVRTARGFAIIDTTSNHLFWDPAARRWVKAGALLPGGLLRSLGAARVTVAGGRSLASRAGWMWDLTVHADHDFYIDTTAGSVLVHNDGCPTSPNQMQRQVSRGQAPRGIDRVDNANPGTDDAQPHVHFDDWRSTLNQDGTWGHGDGSDANLTNKMVEWLLENGWGVPDGY